MVRVVRIPEENKNYSGPGTGLRCVMVLIFFLHSAFVAWPLALCSGNIINGVLNEHR